ncbi:hypothetical protein [Delftia sp. UME58]|uniref:hypothetical protein n=1 Tax=Delftia sp. UME58 TaxID=1862322 RepID=UPI0016047290|nr:hypothetical protein [Delftia sp. UME58]MBB1651637.1 hypothetical protein [Delftia sp. UME58]
MTTAPTPDLRALSNAVKAWACCNEAWPHAEHFDVAVVGGITDGEQYPVAQIDADTYGTDGESLKLAQFYAAANPGAVLALLDRIDALQAENERLLAQVHKLEMDALDLASENSILKRAEEAGLEARKPLPLSDEQIDDLHGKQEAQGMARQARATPRRTNHLASTRWPFLLRTPDDRRENRCGHAGNQRPHRI